MSKTRMLNKTVTTTLILLLTLSMVLAVIPMASAITAPTLNPIKGPVGQKVLVSGTDASAGGLVEVYWENLAGSKLNQTYAKGDGTYAFYVIIPESFQGAHWIVVKDVSTGVTAAAKFTITPTITLTPTSGIQGDPVNVTGTGFTASSTIGIFFDTPTVRLIQSGASTADWAIDLGAAAGLVNIVKLVGAADSDSRAAVLDNTTGITLDTFDPTEISFQYNGTAGTKLPVLELRFVHPDCIDPDDETSTNRGHVDITLQTPGTIAASKIWDTYSGYTESTLVWAFGNKADGTPFTLTTQNVALSEARTDLSGKVTGIGDWKLTRISIQAGWEVIGTYYVDTIAYTGGRTYNLEPPVKTTTSTALGSITTTFNVPAGATTETKKVTAVNVTDLFASADFTVGPAITLTPTTGPTGTVVTITGRGFATTPNTAITITVDSTTAKNVTSLQTNSTYGNFTGQFVVPTVNIGSYTVTADDGKGNTATALFNVTGKTAITLTPSAGAVGSVVTIEGANFTAIAGKAVTVNFGPLTAWATFSTNATGGFKGTSTVPSLATGAYTVVATDELLLTASKSFTIAVTFLSISPVKGPTGTVATVTGYGFTGSTANVTIGTKLVLKNIAVSTLLAGTSFIVPTLSVGNYTVTALDDVGLTASTTFEVNATTQLILTPSSTTKDSTVTIEANYFTAAVDTVITFNIRNATWNTSLTVTPTSPWTEVKTNASGSFKGTFTVLTAWALGDYIINATDANSLTVEAPFSIVAPTPTITLDKYESLIGAVVTVTGTSFKSNATVNIYFGSTLVKTVTSTSGGALPPNTNFTVPNVSYGTYTVNASDGVNYATATFNVLGVYGIDTIQAIVTAIEDKLEQYGSFWNFTNTWFTTIENYVKVINWTDIDAIKGKTFEMWADITDSTHGLAAIKNAVDAINFTAIDNKLGIFNGTDTAASLLYDIHDWVSEIVHPGGVIYEKIEAIKNQTDTIDWADITAILTKVTNIEDKILLAPSELKFDFGTATSLWEHDYIQVTETTAYSADTGYGWTNTTGLYSRDRGAPDYTRRDFVFSPLNRTFQVDLPNGNYTVIITMGDQSYAHDNMTIYAEGTFKANVTTPAGTYKQIVFTVTVTDGSLELTFADAGGVDVNWVINSLIIQRNWK